jgi:hypothetical protein
MNASGFTLMLLPSTNLVMRAEKILLAYNLKCKLIPVPRDISSECGVCLRIQKSDQESAVALLEEMKMKGLRTREY